ncbi:PepSY domain-containing protein [Rhodopirellula sp. JC740]|uniref:PepSY domain-containing protein n=1 Tax=Rhodopirellula halodulae TaxID=2894198 RepID=A0ABS8NEU3_9BACT|nr:PepSY domain-containing protein [Rhodopirellula sp. JC740]MCC9642072.1 PepSY domain-containing protein [Rhodopirellula sp. JC740]
MSATIESPESQSETTSNSGLADEPAQTTSTKPKRKPKKKTWYGKLGRSSLMLVRRTHLYSGIFMFPFVLLYGFTGWFFNHPRLFTGDEVRSFAAADLSDGLLRELPTPDALAASVVEEMNLESFLIGGPTIELSDTRSPRFTGFLSYTVNTESASHQVTVNPHTGDGEIRTTHVVKEDEAADDEPKLNPLAGIFQASVPGSPLDVAKNSVPKVLDELGLESGEAFTGRRSPSLEFAAIADGVPCIVTWNMGNGGITSIREDSRPQMETKSFLQRLHLARHYSPGWDVRWVWALIVDVMFVSMVFWGVSGLMMWWQVKRTRMLGAGVLIASFVFTAMLAMNMHDSMTTGAGRGGRGGGGGGGNRGASIATAAPSDALTMKSVQQTTIDTNAQGS